MLHPRLFFTRIFSLSLSIITVGNPISQALTLWQEIIHKAYKVIKEGVTKMKRVLLLLLLVACATMSMAQERHGSGSFSPAAGIANIKNYDIAWESGLTLSSELRTSADGKLLLIGGIGATIGGYDINPSPNPDPTKPDTPGGIQESQIAEISVFPNPAQRFAVVSLGENCQAVAIELYNTLGVNLMRLPVQDNNRVQLDLCGLANGVYVVRAVDAHGQLVGRTKLAVQR